MKKKLFLIITFIFMLFISKNVYAEEEIKGNYDLRLDYPEIGKKISIEKKTYEKFSIINMEWYIVNIDGSLTKIDNGTIVQENKFYKAKITIKPNNGYKFTHYCFLEFNNNAYFQSQNSNLDDETGLISLETSFVTNTDYNFLKGYIDAHDYFSTSVVGKKRQIAPLYINSGYKVVQRWFNVTDNKVLGKNDIYENGKTYRLDIIITGDDEHKIIPSIVALQELSPFSECFRRSIDVKNNQIFISAYYTFKLYDYGLKPVKINGFEGPEIGKNPSDISSGKGYTIIDYYWFDDYANRRMSKNDTFREGKEYTFNLSVRLDDGYTIDSDNFFKHYYEGGTGNTDENDPSIENIYESYKLTDEFYEVSTYGSFNLINNRSFLVNNKLYLDFESENIDLNKLTFKLYKNNSEMSNLKYEINGDTLIISGVKFNISDNYNLVVNYPQSSNFIFIGGNNYFNAIYDYVIMPTVSDNKVPYDRKKHSINIGNDYSGGTLIYSTDMYNWSDTLPEFSKVGNYDIYVDVKPDSVHSNSYPVKATLTIEKSDISNLKGDVDCDNKISLSDVILCLKVYFDDGYNEAGDVDGDGRISLSDVILILKQYFSQE